MSALHPWRSRYEVGVVESCVVITAMLATAVVGECIERVRLVLVGATSGWELTGTDDWLIGLVAGDELLRLAWMDEDRDDVEELADAAGPGRPEGSG